MAKRILVPLDRSFRGRACRSCSTAWRRSRRDTGAPQRACLEGRGRLFRDGLVGARWLRALSITDYLASFRSVSGGITALLFLLFAAMPTLVDGFSSMRS